MTKLWNESLWDTFNPHVYNYNKYNFEFLTTFREFIKQRSRIEENYCKDLRKLCSDFRPKEYSKKKDVRFSVQIAFNAALSKLAALVEHREQSVRQMHECRQELRLELTDMREVASTTERRIADLFRELEDIRKKLTVARNLYHRSHAELAKVTGEAAAELAVEQRHQMHATRYKAYKADLDCFNSLQRSIYRTRLPEQLNRLEMLQRNCCTVSRIRMNEWAQSEVTALTVQTRCAGELSAATGAVDPEGDAAAFLCATVSGRPLPADLTLEEPPTSLAINQRLAQAIPKEANDPKPKPRVEELSESELREEAIKQKNKINGLRKLRDAYRANPALGNPAAVEAELLAALGTSGQLQESLTAAATKGHGCTQALADEFAEEEADDVRVATAPSVVAVVLYDFIDPSQPSALAVTEGERVHVLQPDPDWTMVARLDGSETGFVPTAYIAE